MLLPARFFGRTNAYLHELDGRDCFTLSASTRQPKPILTRAGRHHPIERLK